jgi:serine/threonine-protein kinase
MNASSEQMAARRYRIERYLTEGGMGAIYIGKKLGPGGFEKEVVLKQLLPEYTARPEFRDLFFREAKISATLDHANIVHTFDLVESDDSLFIVMEYVRGVDLRTIVRRSKLRRRELAPQAALHIALEILAGLGYAHARKDPSGTSLGIIHRDVSPSNILCSAHGEVKLSDFGIAKASTHSSVFYRVRGKVGYMSPEQARNEPIDHRSDLYSLGVCLYEALTLERLFVGDLSTPADVIYNQPIVPPSRKRTGLPPAIDAVMARALAPKPADRFQDAGAFAEALRQLAHRSGLLFSAPQLGEHLRNILGSDSGRWLSDDSANQAAASSTQKIPPAKELEGKEAQSIGVVEGSNLYVVSGGDVISGRVSAPPAPAPVEEPSIPIEEDDDDEPTKARPMDQIRSPPRGIPLRAPLSPPRGIPLGGADHPRDQVRRHPSAPPAPAAWSSPLPPEEESPFDAEPLLPSLQEEFPPTPAPADFYPPTPPPPTTIPPPFGHAPAPAYTHAPPPPPPYAQPPYAQPAPWAQPPLNLAPPPTMDFGSDFPALPLRRSGPPRLLVLVLMMGAAAGGAKLAEVVTRPDRAALAALEAPRGK